MQVSSVSFLYHKKKKSTFYGPSQLGWSYVCVYKVYLCLRITKIYINEKLFLCGIAVIFWIKGCWYSFVKLDSYELVLICIKVMSYELKWNYIDIGAFHYSQVAKSILWTVIGCWPSEGGILVYIYIYILACFSLVTGSVLSYCQFYFCLPAGRWLVPLSQ